MHKQIYQQFLVVVASARWALSLGPCPLDPWPARLQLPLGIVDIFVLLFYYCFLSDYILLIILKHSL